MSQRERILFFTRIALSLGITTYLVSLYGSGVLLEQLRRAPLQLLLYALALGIVGLFSYSWMTSIVSRHVGLPLTSWQVLKITLQTRFYALFMPGASNLIVKWYKFSRRIRPLEALALMTTSRVLLIWGILLLAVAGMCLDLRFPWPELRTPVLVAFASITLCSVVVFLCFLLTYSREKFMDISDSRPSKFTDRFKRKAMLLLYSLSGMRLREVMAIIALSILGNTLEAIQHIFVASAAGIDLSIFTIAWLRGVILICAIVPVSFAGLGVREASLVSLLVYYGIDEASALAYSLLFFAVCVLGRGLIGGLLEYSDWYFGMTPEGTRGGLPTEPKGCPNDSDKTQGNRPAS